MKTEINRLIKQLETSYSGRNWVDLDIAQLLKTIDFATATERKIPGRHTILELVQHVNAWRTFLLKRLQGDEEFNISPDNGLDWRNNLVIDEALWEATIAEFKDLHLAILEQLRQQDDSLLDRTVAQRTYNFAYLINGVIHHDYYHFGQIALLQ